MKNPEPIAPETLFLPSEKGGLEILVPSIQSQALRTKFLSQLENENNTIMNLPGKILRSLQNSQ